MPPEIARTSKDGRGRLAATMRRLPARIGELLGPAQESKGGRGKKAFGATQGLDEHERHDFRQMAAHRDVVEEVPITVVGEVTRAPKISDRPARQVTGNAVRQVPKAHLGVRIMSSTIDLGRAGVEVRVVGADADATVARVRRGDVVVIVGELRTSGYTNSRGDRREHRVLFASAIGLSVRQHGREPA